MTYFFNFSKFLKFVFAKLSKYLTVLPELYLLKLENTFKTVIAHEFSKKYGHDNYLKIDNFDTSNEQKITSAIKLIGDIQQETARQMNKHHQVVTHYMTEHGYIPLWVLVNVLTFGKIDLKEFMSSMNSAFNKLQKQLTTISATDIMSIMGYNSSWKNLSRLP